MDEQTIAQMFELIYANMYTLMPTGNAKGQDYALWRQAFDDGLRNGMRHLLYFREDELWGYISYVVTEADSAVHLCEFQTCPRSRRDGTTFRRLISRFLCEIKGDAVHTIRTYANDRNPVSQSLIEKLGFELVEKTHGGKRYSVSKDAFLGRLGRLLADRALTVPGGRLRFYP